MPILNAPGMRPPEPKDQEGKSPSAEKQISREALYAQVFKVTNTEPVRAGGLFEQVNGYGVQLFSQASSFRQS